MELNRWPLAHGPATGSVLHNRSCSHSRLLLSDSPLCLWTLHCRSTLKNTKIIKSREKVSVCETYRACAVQALLLGSSDAVGSCVGKGVESKAQACVSQMNQLQKKLKQDAGDSFRQLKEPTSQAVSAASVHLTHTHGFHYTLTYKEHAKSVIRDAKLSKFSSTSKSQWSFTLSCKS